MGGSAERNDGAGKIEVERKYAVGDGFEMPDLSGVPAVAAVTSPQTYHLTAIYYDTEGFDLASAKITLRRRIGGTDDGWHLKLPAGAARREVHAPLGPGDEPVPTELTSLVSGRTGQRPLRPIARLRTARTVRHLLDRDGRILAEVADDQVTGSVPVPGQPDTHGPSADGPSTGGPSTGGPSTGGPSTGGPSTGGPSTGGPDPDAPSAGASDAGASDAGAPDAGAPDAGAPDAGAPDAGAPDAGGASTDGTDAGTPSAGGPDAEAFWQRSSAWREVEVELDAGGPEILDAAAAVLLAAGARPSPSASKLSQVLSAAGHPPPANG